MIVQGPGKICLIVSSLSAGGAERVISLLANGWVANGRAVSIVTLSSTAGDAYEMDARVQRVGLDLEIGSSSAIRALKHNVLKIRGLRRAVVSLRPDVVVSFMDKVNILSILACAGLGVPVVVCERTHPVYHSIGRGWSLLRRLTYPHADALVLQSEAPRAWAQQCVSRERTFVIPNPVGHEFSEAGATPRMPIVLGVGRLSNEKGFDLLIRAFGTVGRRHPEWSLVIVGQGPKEADLKTLAAALVLESAVRFPGVVHDPERYYRTAGIFVLPSRFEGFPNALLEAMATGCAVIAANCPGGTSEIVRNGVDGRLIPPEDVDALAKALDQLIADEDERNRLGSAAVEVRVRFGLARVVGLWDDVISKVQRPTRARGSASG